LELQQKRKLGLTPEGITEHLSKMKGEFWAMGSKLKGGKKTGRMLGSPKRNVQLSPLLFSFGGGNNVPKR